MGRERDSHVDGSRGRCSPAGRSCSHLARLEAALTKVAHLVIENPRYAPIFQRLEHEITCEKAKLSKDPLARARAVIAQNAIGASSPAIAASLPPSP
jgi:hypothetical protein